MYLKRHSKLRRDVCWEGSSHISLWPRCPRSQGSPTETAGQEPPSAWGEVGMAVSYKDRPLSSFHARLSTCWFYFHIVNLLFGLFKSLLLSQFESSLCSSEWSTGFFVTPGFEVPRAKKVGSSSTKSGQSHFTELL